MSDLPEHEFNALLEAIERGEQPSNRLPPDDAADLALAGRLVANRVEPSPRLLAEVAGIVAAPSSSGGGSLSSALSRVTKRGLAMAPRRVPAWKRVAWSLLIVLLAFGITLVLFPSARAAVLSVFRKVGQVTFEELDHDPAWPEEVAFQNARTMRLSQAQQEVPFTFGRPTWAPDGYRFKDYQVGVLEFEGRHIVSLHWQKSLERGVVLMATDSPADDEADFLVPAGSIRIRAINGRPAALVRGHWQESPLPTTLVWEHDGIVYSLSGTISEENMLRMAESMQYP